MLVARGAKVLRAEQVSLEGLVPPENRSPLVLQLSIVVWKALGDMM